MPARRYTKTYLVATGPNTPNAAPIPSNPYRIGIFIQNTGANPGLARFGGQPLGNGSDIAFTAGQDRKWDQQETCPQETVAFSSGAATTWCVMETVGPAT